MQPIQGDEQRKSLSQGFEPSKVKVNTSGELDVKPQMAQQFWENDKFKHVYKAMKKSRQEIATSIQKR